MIATLGAVLLASLAGSLHCAGMCGGIVALVGGEGAAAGQRGSGGDARRASATRRHAAYHLGRLAGYATMGAAAGALGAALDLGGAAVGVGHAAIVIAAAVLLAAGATMLAAAWGGRRLAARAPRFLQSAYRRGFALLTRGALGPTTRAGLLGLLTVLLPCGWLYLFAVAAAGTGEAWRGALLMAAFWLGTVPALAIVGVGVQRLSPALRRRAPVLTAATLIAFGAWGLLGRWHLPAFAGSEEPACCASAEAGS